MAINKVTLNGETQMDVTDDTVAPSNLLTGYQATGANGQKVQGAVNGLVPSGGTAGQVLKKNSATDYDVAWGDDSVSGILSYAHGGTGTNSLKVLSQRMFKQVAADGSDDLQVLTAYPSVPGVYRVGQPSIAGLPTGITGYGCLVIFNGGSYWLHMYIDSNNGIYFSRKDSSAKPTTWAKATTTSVSART